MVIKSEINEDILILSIDVKRATVDSADLLKDKLIKSIQEGMIKIIINLQQVEFVDSSFLSSLLAGLKQVSTKNGDIKLVGLQPSVRYIFQITRLEKVFDIHQTVESAKMSF